MVLCAERVLASRVEPIHLLLELRVGLRMGKQTVEDARHCARCGVGAGDDSEHPVIIQLTGGRRRSVREIFIVLFGESARVSSRAQQEKRGTDEVMEEVRRRRTSCETLRGTLFPMAMQGVERPRRTRYVANVDSEPRHMPEERRQPNVKFRQRRKSNYAKKVTHAIPLSRTAQTLFLSPSLSSSDPPPNLRTGAILVLLYTLAANKEARLTPCPT